MPLSAQQRFTALANGEVDVLSRNTTWTLQRDTKLGLNFTNVTFYDGQGFMVPKKLNVKSAKELNGATVCVQSGTTTELNLADYFRANSMEFKPVVIENQQEVLAAFISGRCDVYTTDASGLASQLVTDIPNGPDDYMILPEIISKEPLGPAVRQGDEQWTDIVKYTVYALIQAEESGHHRRQRRPDGEGLEGPERAGAARHPECRRQGFRQRRGARPRRAVGAAGDQGGRQLRRDLRSQHRAARSHALDQRVVVEGRPDVRPAAALILRSVESGHEGVRPSGSDPICKAPSFRKLRSPPSGRGAR